MSTLKIEHVNPTSGKSVAFDVMRGDDLVETVVLTHGQSRVIDMSNGLVLKAISQAEIDERARKEQQRLDLETEIAREQAAKDAAERAEREAADREAEKQRMLGEGGEAHKDEAEGSEGREPLGEPVA